MNSIILIGLAMAVSGAPQARADVPPPNDYVETCTVAKQQAGGKQCVSCNAWHGEMDKCAKSVGSQGYEHVCKGWGASTWDEVWCKAGTQKQEVATPPPVTPDAGATDKPTNEQPMPKTADVPAPKKSSCAGGGAETGLGLAAALWLFVRKRSA